MSSKGSAAKLDDINVGEAVSELKESFGKVVDSATNLAKSVDWKDAAPKIALGALVLYGLRRGKLFSGGLVSSVVMGLATQYIIKKMGGEAGETESKKGEAA